MTAAMKPVITQVVSKKAKYPYPPHVHLKREKTELVNEAVHPKDDGFCKQANDHIAKSHRDAAHCIRRVIKIFFLYGCKDHLRRNEDDETGNGVVDEVCRHWAWNCLSQVNAFRAGRKVKKNRHTIRNIDRQYPFLYACFDKRFQRKRPGEVTGHVCACIAFDICMKRQRTISFPPLWRRLQQLFSDCKHVLSSFKFICTGCYPITVLY